MWASHDDDSYETGKFGQCCSRQLYIEIKSVLLCRPPFCCCWIFQVACSHYPPGPSGLYLPFLKWTQHNPLCGSEGHTVKIMSILASQAYTQNPRGYTSPYFWFNYISTHQNPFPFPILAKWWIFGTALSSPVRLLPFHSCSPIAVYYPNRPWFPLLIRRG